MAAILKVARHIPVIRRQPTAAQLRLASGLVLFAFASTHFLNHAAGLVSIDLMESVRDIRTAVTRSAPGTIVLLAAAITHFVLGVWRFLKRRTLRVRPNEWVQLSFGLLIPLLLLRHIIGTRIVHEVYGVNDNYIYALWTM
jgi:adenylate cyclase